MNWALIVVPLSAGAAGAAVGLVLGRLGQRWPVARQLGYALAAAILLVAVGLMIAARASQGWDGLGYFIMSFLMALPAGLGAAVGTWAGFRRYGR